MALVRILVDGYSLLHNWLQLAPGKARYSAEARDELIQRLTLYRDAVGTPITIVFDGSQSRRGKMPETANPEFEVLYSHAGQTADDVIERVVARMQPFGEVLVVTDDYVERDTVAYHGGMTVSCFNFIEDVESALAEQERDIARRNRAERRRFKNTQ
jgi:predicted RNA-binding protein with PIN domain